MPPGEGFPNRFGGYIKRRQLEKNINKYVPKDPQGRGLREAMMGKDPKFEELHEGQQGSRRLTQVQQAGGGRGPISTQDREYLKPGQQAPESVKEHYAERRGADGHQARYYSKREAARALDEQKNGPDKRDSNLEEEENENSKPFYYNNPSEMTKGGENEMAPTNAPTNAPKTPQDPQADRFQMAVENEVAAAKRVSQKSKARSAKANARVASARADEAEVKARRAEEDREVHIGEILHKLDSNISKLVVNANPNVSDVYMQLEKTIDIIEKDLFGSDKTDVVVGPRPSPKVQEDTTPEKKPQEGRDYDRHVQPRERETVSSHRSSQSSSERAKKPHRFPIASAGENEIEGIDKQNPFAMLGANLGRQFRIAGKAPKENKNETQWTPTKKPDSPTSTTTQPKSVAEQLGQPSSDSGPKTTSSKSTGQTTTGGPTTTPPKSKLVLPGDPDFHMSNKNDLRRKKRRKK